MKAKREIQPAVRKNKEREKNNTAYTTMLTRQAQRTTAPCSQGRCRGLQHHAHKVGVGEKNSLCHHAHKDSLCRRLHHHAQGLCRRENKNTACATVLTRLVQETAPPCSRFVQERKQKHSLCHRAHKVGVREKITATTTTTKTVTPCSQLYEERKQTENTACATMLTWSVSD